MEIQVFRNRKSSQTNANLHYSNYSYSGLIPNERALRLLFPDVVKMHGGGFTQLMRLYSIGKSKYNPFQVFGHKNDTF